MAAGRVPLGEIALVTTRLAVGSALLAGEGLVRVIVEAAATGAAGAGAGPGEEAAEPTTAEGGRWGPLLLGVGFATERRMIDGARAVHRMARGGGERASPLLDRLADLPVVAPLRRRVEAEVDALVARGRAEDAASRELVRSVLRAVGELSVDGVVANPEVRDLLLTRTRGAAEEVADGVRARTLGADAGLERVVRSLLRRRPRESLPEPPLDLDTTERT
ncbi:MAG: hypothetical protein M5U14_08370 [Acidimicrobiia bacterium]|nr:hypothetical protein [Acidimicrobiia bacterium]